MEAARLRSSPLSPATAAVSVPHSRSARGGRRIPPQADLWSQLPVPWFTEERRREWALVCEDWEEERKAGEEAVEQQHDKWERWGEGVVLTEHGDGRERCEEHEVGDEWGEEANG
jgi:hypothetical protein